jgi:hypothetical protein
VCSCDSKYDHIHFAATNDDDFPFLQIESVSINMFCICLLFNNYINLVVIDCNIVKLENLDY